MTFKTLMTTAAAIALATTTAYAADETVDGETLNRQNPQPADSAVEGGTDFNGVVTDAAADLQNGETTDRQNPQAVDPIFDLADADMETIETFQAVEGKNGSPVLTKDGILLGTLQEMGIDNAGKGEITIDISKTQAVLGDSLVITTGPENVMINKGRLVVAASADEISLLAGGDRGADDGRANVFLN